MNKVLSIILRAAVAVALFAAVEMLISGPAVFYKGERTIIRKSDSVMYVTTVSADRAVLREPSKDLTDREMKSPLLRELTSKMLSTVRSPEQDGVGIAAPQVGVGRRVIWVQRFDLEGEPFRCYLNPHIDSLGGEIVRGPEGCLSVPPMRGIVPRHSEITVSYIDPETMRPATEKVGGYTAVIFQHECDHLDGILYIDRADSVFVSESWAEERKNFDYSRPGWYPVR